MVRSHPSVFWVVPLAGGVLVACGREAGAPIAGPPRVAAVVLSASALDLYEGQATSITAAVRDARGLEIVGQTLTWTVMDTTVATVSGSGVVAARRAGATTVKATAGGVADSARVTVRPVPVRQVVLTPATLTLVPGEWARLTATLRDSAGRDLGGRAVKYATSDTSVATVDVNGVVTAIAIGGAEISATSEGTTGRAQVTVRPPPVAILTLSPSRATFVLGRSVQLTARAQDARGNPLVGRAVTFTSGNPLVATVTSGGLVTGARSGSTYVTAASEGKTALATITVLDPTVGSYVRLESDPSDWIGLGQTYEYTAENAIILVSAFRTELVVNVSGEEGWQGTIRLPAYLERLEAGTYTGLTRHPFASPATGGMDWTGGSRGCNELVGSVTIDSVFYAVDDLVGIDLSFVQHCERSPHALRGIIHWRSTDPPHRPSGPLPIPAGLWAPPPAALPTSGSYLYLQSEPGDWVGQGRTYLHTPQSASMIVTVENPEFQEGHATIRSVAGEEWWVGNLQAMAGLRRLEVGFYPDVRRYPFHNRLKGGMDWSGLHNGCNELSGWFVVDAVSYVDGEIATLDARFVQHCEHATPALRGAIRWRR